MRTAVQRVEADQGAVDVLVNNAGFGIEGAVESVPLEDARHLLETNVLGPVRLSQLVLPGMRRQGWGRIVNVSSVGGRLVVPGGAVYHASKYALEAISDALRFEVRGFGVDVVLVEPGPIRTRWLDTALGPLETRPASDDLYAGFHASLSRVLRGTSSGILSLASAGPDAVARVIERAMTERRPRTRYVVPRVAGLFLAGRRALPDRAWDAVMRLLISPPRRPADP